MKYPTCSDVGFDTFPPTAGAKNLNNTNVMKAT